LGVGALDFDGDGLLDVFVSNDAMGYFLWRNMGGGRFEDQGLFAGVAFSEGGAAAAAMAVEVGDFDRNGRLDLLVPDMDVCCLYSNVGSGMFEDVAVRSGIARSMTGRHGWGAVLADLDLDGLLDAYIACGAAGSLEAHGDRVLLGVEGGRFRDVSEEAGSVAAPRFVSRGVARGDFDDDGDIDLLVAHLNARPSLLRNDTPRRGRHWLAVRLVGRGASRDPVGAVVKVTTARWARSQPRLSAGSYLSQHDPRIHFGLGDETIAKTVEVTWPGGQRQVLRDVPAGRELVVREPESARAAPR
jgi:hypothetical protein